MHEPGILRADLVLQAGLIVAPCDCRPAMPAARRGPGLLSGLSGVQVVAAAGVPAAAVGVVVLSVMVRDRRGAAG
jgi:hypothetical protein